MRALLLVASALLLSACGFQLRGSYPLPFATLHLAGIPEVAELHAQIKRTVEAGSGTRIVGTPKEAEATLTLIQLRQLLADIQANPRRYFTFSVF